MNRGPTLKLSLNKKIKQQIFDYFEAERERIAEVLLEDIAQLVFAAKIKANTPGQNPQEYLSLVLEKVRDLAYELQPRDLDQIGISSAIDRLINNRLSKKLHIMQSKPPITGIDNLAQVAIYRLIQIAINWADTNSIEKFEYFVSKKDYDIVITFLVRYKVIEDQSKTISKHILIKSLKPILYLFSGTYRVKYCAECTTMRLVLKHY